jgi:hypothetical protein
MKKEYGENMVDSETPSQGMPQRKYLHVEVYEKLYQMIKEEGYQELFVVSMGRGILLPASDLDHPSALKVCQTLYRAFHESSSMT